MRDLVYWISVHFKRRRRVMLLGTALVFLCLLQGRRFIAIIHNNRGAHLLDRALLTPFSPDLTIAIVDAGRQFQGALRYDPQQGLSYYNLGTIYVHWGDTLASAEAFAQAVSADANDQLAHLQLGLAQASLGDETAARVSWQRAGAGAFFVRRAKAYVKADDIDAGLLDVQRAIDIGPANANAYYALADVYAKQQDYEAALHVYWTAPDQAESYYRAGKLLRRLDRTAEAIAILQESLALQPDHKNARLELGRAYVDVGACDQAYAWLSPLLARNFWRAPDSKSYVLMGQCLLNQGDPLSALSYLSEAVALDKKSVNARWLMGQAYDALGYRDAAIDMYRQVLRLKPEYGPATKALEVLGVTVP